MTPALLLTVALGGPAHAVPHDLIGGGEPVEDDLEALAALQEGMPAVAAPVRWQLDPAASRIYAQVEPDARTLDNPRSHRHVVRAHEWTGHLTLAEGGRCAGEVTVPVARLHIDDPEDRSALGVEGELNRWDKADVLTHMLDAEQLDAVGFPTMDFKVDRCTALRPADDPEGPVDGWTVEGRITIHGVTQPLKIDLKGDISDTALALSGTVYLRQTSFGIEPYFALFGQRRNRDAVKLDLRLVASPAPEDEADDFAPIQSGPAVETLFQRKP